MKFVGDSMEGFAFEKHYRVKELAGLWGLSPKTVSRIFGSETGVIRVANEGKGKRMYTTLSIPESVISRVHERLGENVRSVVESFKPVRIIRLRESAAVPRAGSRNIRISSNGSRIKGDDSSAVLSLK
jgi:hypothetical protein